MRDSTCMNPIGSCDINQNNKKCDEYLPLVLQGPCNEFFIWLLIIYIDFKILTACMSLFLWRARSKALLAASYAAKHLNLLTNRALAAWLSLW